MTSKSGVAAGRYYAALVFTVTVLAGGAMPFIASRPSLERGASEAFIPHALKVEIVVECVRKWLRRELLVVTDETDHGDISSVLDEGKTSPTRLGGPEGAIASSVFAAEMHQPYVWSRW